MILREDDRNKITMLTAKGNKPMSQNTSIKYIHMAINYIN